jgi:transcriptional regulator with XRE-family HTH domain
LKSSTIAVIVRNKQRKVVFLMAKAEFKDRLKQAMDVRNMKAVDLCEKTKIPKGAISYYLSGRSTPKADRLYIICKALDVSEAWMLGYDVGMAKTKAQKNNDTIADIVAKFKTDDSFSKLLEALVNDEEFLNAVKAMHSFATKDKDVSGN